jgi:hypothetical protein
LTQVNIRLFEQIFARAMWVVLPAPSQQDGSLAALAPTLTTNGEHYERRMGAARQG